MSFQDCRGGGEVEEWIPVTSTGMTVDWLLQAMFDSPVGKTVFLRTTLYQPRHPSACHWDPFLYGGPIATPRTKPIPLHSAHFTAVKSFAGMG
ncbi:hypothetical protein GCM10011491_08950 [Brucella endophytica]|uniref:Uncharacterized protein n=1 Tax=Brucella endophytica TaxID=1963359 RepID=A0A916WBM4_9HYPH|nr:hypothetical protein GCM10011491_08950 [Brucella endophytica]